MSNANAAGYGGSNGVPVGSSSSLPTTRDRVGDQFIPDPGLHGDGQVCVRCDTVIDPKWTVRITPSGMVHDTCPPASTLEDA